MDLALHTMRLGARDSSAAALVHHLGARGHLGAGLTELRLGDAVEACLSAAQVAALTCSVAGRDPPRQSRLAQPASADGVRRGRAA